MDRLPDALPPTLLDRFAAIIGEKNALREPNDIAPYVKERRGLWPGTTPLVLRPADTGRPPTGHPFERVMHAIGGTLAGYLVPQSMQPLRPHLVARAALDAPDRLGPGTHVLNAPAIRELLDMDTHATKIRRRLRG